MSGKFAGCIADALAQAVEAGASAEEQAALREAAEDYDEIYAAAAETLSPDEADRTAGKAAMGALEAKALEAARLRALSIRSRRTLLEGVAGLKGRRGYQGVTALGGKGGKPPKDGWTQGGQPPKDGPGSRGGVAARALEFIVENKPGLAGAPFASIEGRYRAIRGQLDAMMAEVIERFETRTGFDAPGRATLETMVREVFGEDTGDAAAKGLAKAWGETAERIRMMFNAAGGDIARRADWGLPQHHDPIALRQVGREAWVEEIMPRLAREKMVDRVTGAAFTERRLKATLSEIYDTIATGGAINREPGERLGRGMLAKQRREERFLVFRSADDWMAYQEKFGSGDPFGIMMGHLDEMARDVARMQILGPNPDHQFDWLVSFAQREAAIEEGAGVKGAIEKAQTYVRTTRNMYDHFVGGANVPERAWLAEVGATTRSYLTGPALGSAIISDLPSAPVFGAMARAFSGLSRSGDMGQLVGLLASPAARARARRSGFIIEQATDGLIRGAQESLRLSTVGTRVDGRGFNAFARRLPGATFRLTGLTGWTSARKRSFRLEFMGALADRAGTSIAALAKGDAEDRAFAQLLVARGFTEADWAKIGAAEAWAPATGASFLRPKEIMAAAGDDLGLRVAEMIELQTRQAVPETTLWTRAKLLGVDQPGTFKGEFNRSWAMFRSFTLTAWHLYAEEIHMRALASPNALAVGGGMVTGLVAALTMAGGISIQLREITKGNDPRDMTDWRFWGAALMQGGGLGILGDFLYASENRVGKSSSMSGWGPAAGFGADSWGLTGGNALEVLGGLAKDKPLDEAVADAHIGREVAVYAGRYNPLASVWWARAAVDRGVVDQLQRLLDPEADASFRQRARRAEREYGQDQWWPEGQALPERAPDVGAVMGEPRP